MASITSEEVRERVNQHLSSLELPTGLSAVAEIGIHERCGKEIVVLKVTKDDHTRRFLGLHSPYENWEVEAFIATLTVENLMANIEAPSLHQAIIQMFGILMMVENSFSYPVRGNPIWN